MPRRLAGLACATFLVGASAPSTITLGEVEGQDAMAVKARLLPPDIAAKVEEGSLKRMWMPTVVFNAAFIAPARAAAPDVCRRKLHVVRIEGPRPQMGEAEPQTPLTITAPRTVETAAIRVAETGADAKTCAAEESYVALRGSRTLEAYRQLVTAIRAAAAPGKLSFAITCQPEENAACQEPRMSLAQLPMAALSRIDVGHYENSVNSGWHLQFMPEEVLATEGYDVQARFRATGEDRRSWRIILARGDGAMPDIVMRRAEVFYH